MGWRRIGTGGQEGGQVAYCTNDGVELFIDLYPTLWIVSWGRFVLRMVQHETTNTPSSVPCPLAIHILCCTRPHLAPALSHFHSLGGTHSLTMSWPRHD